MFRLRLIPILALLFLLLQMPALAASFTAAELEQNLGERITRIEEFEFLRKEAEKLGVRAWLFGGTAASYGHYVNWDMKSEKGDTRYRRNRFDYDYSNIFRSTQDLDIVIDGTPEQANKLREALAREYPHLTGDKASSWEVRLLKQDMGDKLAILNNPDFLNQHSDSNSTGLIEVTKPVDGESPVRDVMDWNAKEPFFLRDVHEGKLHYYFNPKHETTRFFKDGRNPPILSVLRYLTKAFQFELELRPDDLKQIKKIVDEFDPRGKEMTNDYVRNWLLNKENGRKLVQNPVNMEYAFKTLDDLGLREKLLKVENTPNEQKSFSWWLNKKPLKSDTLGKGSGPTARELGIKIVAHEADGMPAWESITKAHTGDPNVFVSRQSVSGEAAAYGEGFYTKVGVEGARGTGFTVRFELHPDARQGTDFDYDKDAQYVVVKNKKAIKVIPESLDWTHREYFDYLFSGNKENQSNKALFTMLKRRLKQSAPNAEDIHYGYTKVMEALNEYKPNYPLYDAWMDTKPPEPQMREAVLKLIQQPAIYRPSVDVPFADADARYHQLLGRVEHYPKLKAELAELAEASLKSSAPNVPFIYALAMKGKSPQEFMETQKRMMALPTISEKYKQEFLNLTLANNRHLDELKVLVEAAPDTLSTGVAFNFEMEIIRFGDTRVDAEAKVAFDRVVRKELGRATQMHGIFPNYFLVDLANKFLPNRELEEEFYRKAAEGAWPLQPMYENDLVKRLDTIQDLPDARNWIRHLIEQDMNGSKNYRLLRAWKSKNRPVIPEVDRAWSKLIEIKLEEYFVDQAWDREKAEKIREFFGRAVRETGELFPSAVKHKLLTAQNHWDKGLYMLQADVINSLETAVTRKDPEAIAMVRAYAEHYLNKKYGDESVGYKAFESAMRALDPSDHPDLWKRFEAETVSQIGKLNLNIKAESTAFVNPWFNVSASDQFPGPADEALKLGQYKMLLRRLDVRTKTFLNEQTMKVVLHIINKSPAELGDPDLIAYLERIVQDRWDQFPKAETENLLDWMLVADSAINKNFHHNLYLSPESLASPRLGERLVTLAEMNERYVPAGLRETIRTITEALKKSPNKIPEATEVISILIDKVLPLKDRFFDENLRELVDMDPNLPQADLLREVVEGKRPLSDLPYRKPSVFSRCKDWFGDLVN